jgi:DNA/RNA-binding domain of Phe-tRNA-synthetase-like protein
VLADESKLIAIYPYRDAENTKVTESTKNVSIIVCGVPNISKEMLENASEVTLDYITRFCKN